MDCKDSREKDITIILGHRMHFPEVFGAISLDTGEAIHSDRFH